MSMREQIGNESNGRTAATATRCTTCLVAIVLALSCRSTCLADDGDRGGDNNRDHQGQGDDQGDNNGRNEGEGHGYQQVNLVADQAGMALLQDTNLVNSWGVSFGPNTPFWVSDNGTGLTTLYTITNDATGTAQVVKQGLQVTIPGNGTPTGQAFNTLGGFNGDIFLFVSEDGTISGWRPALGTAAETLVPGNTLNVYKGMTLLA